MNDSVIELRSDTFTVPDAAMRRAMAEALVGDDGWGEDPTVRRLEEIVAARLGKEAAVFLPSGTMANLCAVLSQTQPGDEVIADREAHIVVYEAGGSAVVGGIQLHLLDCPSGVPTPEQVAAAVRPPDIHHPTSRLLVLENTHNRRGGLAVAPEAVGAAARRARECGLRVHCDGARLANAAVALRCSMAELVAECDTVSLAFSKGLGAPVGSVLAGDAEVVARARRWRQRLGGGMRQAGILAAACLDALDRNYDRLAEDHENAARIAAALRDVPGVEVVDVPVPTNIVLFRCQRDASEVVGRAAAEGVLITAMDRHLVRCTIHLGIDRAAAERAGEILRRVAAAPARRC